MMFVLITLKYFINAWLFTYLQNDLCDYNLEVFYMMVVIRLQNCGCDYNLEVLAACLQLFVLDNCGVDTSGLNAR